MEPNAVKFHTIPQYDWTSPFIRACPSIIVNSTLTGNSVPGIIYGLSSGFFNLFYAKYFRRLTTETNSEEHKNVFRCVQLTAPWLMVAGSMNGMAWAAWKLQSPRFMQMLKISPASCLVSFGICTVLEEFDLSQKVRTFKIDPVRP